MVNPGLFQGSRKKFLMGEKTAYSDGVAGGYARDALAVIQRRYFKRYPINVPLDAEPTEEYLASVDDEAPDNEPGQPDAETLLPEVYQAKVELSRLRSELVVTRKAQIKCWFSYQYMKDHDLDPTDSGVHNPYRVLLFKLTGKGMTKPRLKSAANVWRKSPGKPQLIEARAKELSAAKKVGKGGQLALRDQIAREEFEKLNEEDRAQWKDQAKEEHQAALAQWKRDAEDPPSTSQEDRQKCIQGLTKFAQPILDMIHDATGWKVTLLAGGPEPAQEGRLHMLSVHSGKTKGDVPLTFGKAERARWRKYILPMFGSFLKACYSPDDCRAVSLPDTEGFESLLTMDLENEDAEAFTVENLAPDTPATTASNSATPAGDDAQEKHTTSSAPAPVVSSTALPPLVLAASAAAIPWNPHNAPASPAAEETGAQVGDNGSGSPSPSPSCPGTPPVHTMFDLPSSPVLHEDLPVSPACSPPGSPIQAKDHLRFAPPASSTLAPRSGVDRLPSGKRKDAPEVGLDEAHPPKRLAPTPASPRLGKAKKARKKASKAANVPSAETRPSKASSSITTKKNADSNANAATNSKATNVVNKAKANKAKASSIVPSNPTNTNEHL